MVSFQLALIFLDNILKNDYTGGLELEQQPYQDLGNGVTLHKFAGTVISVIQSEGAPPSFTCQPLNKNLESLAAKGNQVFPRFISAASLVPFHYKKGMQITSLLRMLSQSSHLSLLNDALITNAAEMFALGYDFEFLVSALRYVSAENFVWNIIAINFLTSMTTRLTSPRDLRSCRKALKFFSSRLTTP